MKLELKLNKRLLIVQFPTEKIFIENHAFFSVIKTASFEEHVVKIICKGSDLTEDVAKGLVEESKYMDIDGNSGYVDYKVYPDGLLLNPLESFISAIESNGYHWGENPVKYPDKNNPKYYDEPFDGKGFYQEIYSSDLADWKKAESRTFNPEKTIIFEIL